MAKILSNARRHTVVRKALAHAQKTAPKDHRAFVDAFREHAFREITGSGSGGGARSLGLRRPTGALLADDPRYLKNVRELAKRSAKAAKNARIIGGSAVGKEFPDCVAVGDDQQWGCTGTLIAPNVVLTAGHCLQLHTRVFVGNDVEKAGRTLRIARHVRHPKWDAHYNNDLMLLILEKPVTGVKPRALATTSLIDAAIDGRVVGFGTTDLAGTTGFGLKQQTDVPIVSKACSGKVKGKTDGAVYGCHLGREIVAGKPLLNHDTCKGDSGGPIYVADGKGKWFLAGVTSRGTDLAQTMCGDGGLYTRVDKYRDWIASASK
jgi:secreted trypsin-like serine protease